MKIDSRKYLRAIHGGLLQEETHELRLECQGKASHVKLGRNQISQPTHTPINLPSYALALICVFSSTQDTLFNSKGVKGSDYQK